MKYKGRFQTFKLSCLLKGGLVISYIQKSINLTNSVKMLAALDLEHISQFVGKLANLDEGGDLLKTLYFVHSKMNDTLSVSFVATTFSISSYFPRQQLINKQQNFTPLGT